MVDGPPLCAKYTLARRRLGLVQSIHKAAGLPCSWDASNERRPIVACTIPALSTRNCTWTCLGVLHRRGHIRRHGTNLGVGHQTTGAEDLTQLPTTHGIGRSNHHIKGHVASLDLGQPNRPYRPRQHQRLPRPWRLGEHSYALVLPVPLGNTTAPRTPGPTSWHPHRVAPPSMDSSNFALANSPSRATRRQQRYNFQVLSIFARLVFCFLVNLAFLYALHIHAHRTGRASDGANCRVQIGCIHVLHLILAISSS